MYLCMCVYTKDTWVVSTCIQNAWVLLVFVSGEGGVGGGALRFTWGPEPGAYTPCSHRGGGHLLGGSCCFLPVFDSGHFLGF